MRPKMTLAAMTAVISVGLLPIKAGGCGGKTACITFSEADFAKAGQCPSQADMDEFFSTDCGFTVASVDGEGTRDGQLCCYPVTNFNDNGVGECIGGFGGEGGFGGVGGGVGGGCVTCGDVIDIPTSPALLCFDGDNAFSNLTICGCNECAECQLNLCKSTKPTVECAQCLRDTCPSEVNDCENSF